MAMVVLYTREARYQGSLGLTTASGDRIRFLDALNHPQRFGLKSLTDSPRLRLQGAIRESLTGDVSDTRVSRTHVSSTFCEELTLRLETVVLGFEELRLGSSTGEAEATVSPATVSPATVYETRVSLPPQRIVLDLENGISLDATVRGGIRTLKRAKLRCEFVACRDVLMSDPLQRLGRRRFPFVAINVLRIEGYSRSPEPVPRPWLPRKLLW